ncbi:MAG: cation:proton antiporter [Deltaproteobacteria bacterium]|nr:cation:proton antiporter [Deltaproteobacteria bacterium]MBW2414821.1 cation:proton antiporter [Deltaproteobacteria bacterium]
MYLTLATLAIFAFAYSTTVGRLERTPVNGAVVFVAFGLLAGPLGLGLLDLDVSGEGVRTIAELTLALVLFTDASSADLAVLRQTVRLPQRLLLLGLPLTIGLGFVAGTWLFPGLGMLEVAVLATMLAPTDAALGKAVVTNPKVPAKIREALNVESGLNDGICVPILFTFLALASQAAEQSTGALALRLVAEEIGIGLVVGVGLSVAAAATLRATARRGWLVDVWLGIPVVALAFACFGLAQFAGGSGFIACFAGGLTFGAMVRKHKQALLEGAEGTGEAFALVTWVVFGAVVVSQPPGAFDWRVLVYAILSLTVVRMLPVFVTVLGLGLRTDAKLFLGWFGPRGLASIVFLVIVFHEKLPGHETLAATTVATVVLSIVAHGLTANPLAAAFAARTSR